MTHDEIAVAGADYYGQLGQYISRYLRRGSVGHVQAMMAALQMATAKLAIHFELVTGRQMPSVDELVSLVTAVLPETKRRQLEGPHNGPCGHVLPELGCRRCLSDLVSALAAIGDERDRMLLRADELTQALEEARARLREVAS